MLVAYTYIYINNDQVVSSDLEPSLVDVDDVKKGKLVVLRLASNLQRLNAETMEYVGIDKMTPEQTYSHLNLMLENYDPFQDKAEKPVEEPDKEPVDDPVEKTKIYESLKEFKAVFPDMTWYGRGNYTIDEGKWDTESNGGNPDIHSPTPSQTVTDTSEPETKTEPETEQEPKASAPKTRSRRTRQPRSSAKSKQEFDE